MRRYADILLTALVVGWIAVAGASFLGHSGYGFHAEFPSGVVTEAARGRTLHVGDRLVAVDGRRVVRQEDLLEALRRHPADRPLAVELRRSGTSGVETVRGEQPLLPHSRAAILGAVVGMAAGLLFLVVGLFVALRPTGRAGRLFFLFSVAVAFLAVPPAFALGGGLAYRLIGVLQWAALLLGAAFFLHFFLLFPAPHPLAARLPWIGGAALRAPGRLPRPAGGGHGGGGALGRPGRVRRGARHGRRARRARVSAVGRPDVRGRLPAAGRSPRAGEAALGGVGRGDLDRPGGGALRGRAAARVPPPAPGAVAGRAAPVPAGLLRLRDPVAPSDGHRDRPEPRARVRRHLGGPGRDLHRRREPPGGPVSGAHGEVVVRPGDGRGDRDGRARGSGQEPGAALRGPPVLRLQGQAAGGARRPGRGALVHHRPGPDGAPARSAARGPGARDPRGALPPGGGRRRLRADGVGGRGRRRGEAGRERRRGGCAAAVRRQRLVRDLAPARVPAPLARDAAGGRLPPAGGVARGGGPAGAGRGALPAAAPARRPDRVPAPVAPAEPRALQPR